MVSPMSLYRLLESFSPRIITSEPLQILILPPLEEQVRPLASRVPKEIRLFLRVWTCHTLPKVVIYLYFHRAKASDLACSIFLHEDFTFILLLVCLKLVSITYIWKEQPEWRIHEFEIDLPDEIEKSFALFFVATLTVEVFSSFFPSFWSALNFWQFFLMWPFLWQQ